MISGSFYNIQPYGYPDQTNIDTLAEKIMSMMYINPAPVIIVCRFCNSHNVISNPTCVQCGAPMGKSS